MKKFSYIYSMDKHVQHVQVPDPKESDDLRLIDRLVYANIKRFMNKDTFTAYPSKKTIADKCKNEELRSKQEEFSF